MSEKVEHIVVIGLGLIGASLIYDIRHHDLAKRVTGVDISEDSGIYLLSKGRIHSAATDIEGVEYPADIVIIATPPSSFGKLARKLRHICKSNTIVMDVGSVKQQAIADISPYIAEMRAQEGYDDLCYIPTHPIAGKEQSGVAAGEIGLFEGKRVIFTPYEEVSEENIAIAINFWENIGGKCEIMAADKHDRIYAYISHLPQIVAYAYCQAVGESGYRVSISDDNGSSDKFADFIRLGGSSPYLWRDIVSANKVEICNAMRDFLSIIVQFQAELGAGYKRREQHHEVDDMTIVAHLVPKIIASCAVSVAAVCKYNDQRLEVFPYAGTGFASITAPAATSPDEYIERISNSFRQVEHLLSLFEKHFRRIFIHIEKDEYDNLLNEFREAQGIWQKLL